MSDNDFANAIFDNIRRENLNVVPSGEQAGRPIRTVKPDPARISNKLVVYHRPRALESEYFRFLKSKIEHQLTESEEDRQGRVVMLTGSSLGTGKTTCSLNLALSFAKAYPGKCLFLDSDSRNSRTASYLGLGQKRFPGLSDVLTLRERAGSVLINTGMSDLIYFPPGEYSEDFVDNLRSEELTILINSLKSRFRYVIIDTPPAFPMPEPAIIARHCDGVILVLGAGRDNSEDLNQCFEALEGAPIVGVILNGIKPVPGTKYGATGYYGKEKR